MADPQDRFVAAVSADFAAALAHNSSGLWHPALSLLGEARTVADKIEMLETSTLSPTISGAAPSKAVVQALAVLDHGNPNETIIRVKDYLRSAAAARSNHSGTDTLLKDPRVLTISDTDLDGLISFITNAIAGQKQDGAENVVPSAVEEQLPEQCPRILKTIHSVAPTVIGPATTISVPEASFITAIRATEGEGPKGRRSSTTATILSRTNVTEIAWIVDQGRLEAEGDRTHSPVVSDIFRLSPGAPSSEGTKSAPRDQQPSADYDSRAEAAVKPELSIVFDDTTQRSSVVVKTGADELDQEAEQVAQDAERRVSMLTRFRKKSIQLGQALGSFMNGDYRNADHRPRRESTIFRLQTALDRIEPARPKQDASIFGALTGAQPIQPVDHYNARKPWPSTTVNTCSEDGQLHTCVQHEMMAPRSG